MKSYQKIKWWKEELNSTHSFYQNGRTITFCNKDVIIQSKNCKIEYIYIKKKGYIDLKNKKNDKLIDACWKIVNE